MQQDLIVIVTAARTPMDGLQGVLADVPASASARQPCALCSSAPVYRPGISMKH